MAALLMKTIQMIVAVLVLSGFLTAPVISQTIDPLVSIASFGGSNLKAIDSAGNLVTTYFPSNPPGNWRLVGNIPEMASRNATAPFVAISADRNATTLSPNANTHCALTADGDFYWEYPQPEWQFLNNIGESSGRAPVGIFIALCPGGRMQAITDMGEHYELVGGFINGAWEYLSSIPEDLGVVSTESQSMGDVKSLFR